MTNWRKEQLKLEDDFVRIMLHDYKIVEITTKIQFKNGTRIFQLPTGEKLGTYKTGYVRRCDSSDRIWQLNPKYKRESRWVFLRNNDLVITRETTWSRALIWSGLARLNYLLEYAKRNYLNTN